MRVGTGRVNCVLKCAPNDESDCFLKGLVRAQWILERRNGFARGSYRRLKEDDRFSGRQIPAEVQWRPNTRISGGGFSAYQTVFGSTPVVLYGRVGGTRMRI